ncbi:MAG: BamA/TamA family outer membrane protein [Deltaproteobacteria bacterium]|nr:BamA/TamA family outer membrane protein [Deltaproteobacteria bacterium]
MRHAVHSVGFVIAAIFVAAGTASAQEAGDQQVVEKELPPIESSVRFVPQPGDKIIGIQVRAPGGINVADVIKLLEFKKGSPFSVSAVRKSIKLLYQTGLYREVKAFAVRAKGGPIVIIELKPRKRIDDIEIRGNPTISDLEVLRAMKVDRHDEFVAENISDMEWAIREIHKKAGFHNAKVSIRATQVGGTIKYRLYVQITEGPPVRIETVNFSGTPHFPAEILRGEIDIGAGDRLDRARLDRGLQRLREFYRKYGFWFANVEYLRDKKREPAIAVDGKTHTAVVPIAVESGARTEIEFKGNRRVPVSELRQLVRRAIAGQDTPVEPDTLAGRLKDHYTGRGFIGVKVTPQRVVDEETGGAVLTFKIQEGPQTLVQDVLFDGNKAVSSAMLREVMDGFVADYRPAESVFDRVESAVADSGLVENRQGYRKKPQHGPSYETDPAKVFVQEVFEKASQALGDYYKSQGYLGSNVSKADFRFAKGNSRVTVKFKVEEGPRTFVKSVQFKGNKGLSSFFLMFKVRAIVSGHVDMSKVEEGRLKILSIYAEEGYIYANVTEDLKYNKDRTRADVVYQIDEGVQVRVGRVILQGNDTTVEAVIMDNVELEPGDLYRPSRATDSQANLLRLQILQGASVQLFSPDEMEKVKDLGVFVKERDPRAIEVSMGVSTQDGVRTAFEYGHLNLFGRALELSTRLKVGYQVFAYMPGYLDESFAAGFQNLKFTDALAREAGAGLNLPKIYGIPVPTSVRFDLVNERTNERVYSMDRIAATPGMEFKIIEPLTVLLSYSVEYKFLTLSELQVPEESLSFSEQQARKTGAGLQWLGSARPTIAFDWRDDKFNPHKGFMVSAGVEYTRNLAKPKLGEVNFIKVNGFASFYIPTSRKTTLALLVGGGAIETLADKAQATADALFYMGGRSTLRGFGEKAMFAADVPADQKLGVKTDDQGNAVTDENGQPVTIVVPSPGGNAYVLYRAEFRFPLSGGFEGGLFVDTGNLWIDPDNFNPIELRPCAGFGLRYKTPVGPLSLDFGINLLPDEAAQEPAGAWSFSVGMF